MEHFNMNIALCKKFDESTQSVIGIMNEVDLNAQEEENKIEINVFTLVSGFGEEPADEMKFDYYLRCTNDDENPEEKTYSGRSSYLFSMTMKKADDKKKEDESSIPTYVGTFQAMSSWKRTIFFPCTGHFEIQVFRNESEIEEKDALERLKKYIKNKQDPVAIYHFDVKR